MKNIFCFCLLLLGFSNIKAQLCGTPTNVPDLLQSIPSANLKQAGPSYLIRIYAHFIRTSASTGGITQAEFNTAWQQLITDFNPHNICFSLEGIDNISSDLYYVGGFSNFTPPYQNNLTNIFNTNLVPNAINIYFFPNNLINQNFAGVAQNVPANAFAIGGSFGSLVYSNTRILSHEMGHCLGLYHTHHQLDGGGSFCADCANGTNCTTCGDFVCDTPPDPYLLNYPNPNCINLSFPSTLIDPCGAVFDPDEKNIMSYTPVQCRQYFSSGQGYRMRLMISNSNVLQATAIPQTYYIQNQSNFFGDFLYATSSSITAGANVTSGLIGDVIYGDNSRIVYRTKNFIKLEPGFLAFPDYSATGSLDASFYAHINPTLCNVLDINNAKVSYNATYKPMLNNFKWYTCWKTTESFINTIHESIKDTLIGNNMYKVIKSEIVDLPNIRSFTMLGGYQAGVISFNYLREDVNQRKVFYRLNNTDVLLYDFNLNVGAINPSSSSYILVKKDSVITNTGLNSRFIFSNSVDSIIWIEGLGNIAHPLYELFPYVKFNNGLFSRLVCAYQNNTLLYNYDNSLLNVTCNSFVGLETLQGKSNGISVSPNPTKGRITITLPPPVEQLVNIEILDCYGRCAFKISGTTNTTEIDISALSKGLYTLKIKALNQVFQSKLVLKD